MNDAQINPSEWDALITSILSKFLSFTYNDALISSLDLQQEAWVALMKAADRYDPTKGARFTTYAYHYIHGHLMRYVRKYTMRGPRPLPLDANEEEECLVPVEHTFEIDSQDAVNVLFDKIKDHKHHDIFREYFIYGKSYRTIASEYGVSYQTIAERIREMVELLNLRMTNENC